MTSNRSNTKTGWARMGLLTCALAGLAYPSTAATRTAPPPSGDLMLEVDAREVPRRLLHARVELAVRPGPLVLAYPKWIPGEHGPTGPVTDLAGLRVVETGGAAGSADGRQLAWRRDPHDMFRFQVEVPAGVERLRVYFDLLSPAPSVGGFTSGASASAQLAMLSWNQLVIYPLDRPESSLRIAPSLTLPLGWNFASGLADVGREGQRVDFATVGLGELIDSPVQIGRYTRIVPLAETLPLAEGEPKGPRPRHRLAIAADSAAALELSNEQLIGLERLVVEAGVLFGSWPYRDYTFLLTLSDVIAHFGLEHHNSSDNRLPERTLIEADRRLVEAGLLPHELVHAWNGKFRRPAPMVTASFQDPIDSEMLWVYEGLTQYLGTLLMTRSGLREVAHTRDQLAGIAEWAGNQKGRSWRPLADTAAAAQLLFPARGDWEAWRRSVDFYDEGVLVWLEVDVRIRELSAGSRSLDDVCRRLFAVGPGPLPRVEPYTFDQLVTLLDQVAKNDWRSFLTSRIREVAAKPPLEGLTGSGWSLGYSNDKPALTQAREDLRNELDFSASLGFTLDATTFEILDIVPGKEADYQGLAPGTKLVAVNWREVNSKRLRDALAAKQAKPSEPLELLVANTGFFQNYVFDYQLGDRFLRLERVTTVEDRLGAILAPRTWKPEPAAAP